MSWLYTVFFSGMLFSAQPASMPVKSVDAAFQPVPAVMIQDETEKFDRTYPFNSNGRFSISNVNGSVTVEGWDRNEVRVEYTKVASTKELLSSVDVKIDASASRIDIQSDYDNWRTNDGRNWRTGKATVDYHVMVPRGAVLNEVEAVNGSVTVSNFTNITKVSAVNGSVKADGIRGTADLSTVNGEVSVDFESLVAGSRISLSTVNGKVFMLMPSDSNATITAETVNGSITNDLGLPIKKGKYVGRNLYGKIGSGDVRVKLESVNGPLTIGRRQDGKQLNPVINLLPQKDKDDDDWDSDTDTDTDIDVDVKAVVAPKVRVEAVERQALREQQRALRDSQRETAKAVKAAQKELVKIQPVISEIAAESIADASKAISAAAVSVNSVDMSRVAESMSREAFFAGALPVARTKKETYQVKGVPQVTVTAPGCGVRIKGWDRSEVQYRVTEYSDRRNAGPVNVVDSHTDSSVNINVTNASDTAREGDFTDPYRRAVIEIYVPRKSNIKVRTNAEIRVESVSGELDLNGSDESINVRDSDGRLTASNSDGRIRVIGFNGEVSARTSDGPIDLEGNFSKLVARASDGAISLSLPEDTSAELDANCPDIEGEGISLTRIKTGDRNIYRMGDGRAKFQVQTSGEIQVRSSNLIKADN